MQNALDRQRIKLVLIYSILFIAIIWTLHWEHVPPGSFGARLDRILRGTYFDFVSWEAQALTGKLGQQLTSPQHYIDEARRKQFVLDYVNLVSRIYQVQSDIARLYVDPEVSDPLAVSAEYRATLAQLQAQKDQIQDTAEAILEEQVSSVLQDEGFALLGQVVPPVSFDFTPLPRYLIISPRSEIALSYGTMLRGDLSLDRIEQIEAQIDDAFNVSSLIVPIGGLAVYPAMMNESASLSWTIGAIGHEWTHHYYFFWLKPVGMYYGARPDVRTINETAADISGEAIKQEVLARYYPELLPPPTPTPDPDATPMPTTTPDPPAFDFMAEMRETRVETDRLLAEGKIKEAETYMKVRRRLLSSRAMGSARSTRLTLPSMARTPQTLAAGPPGTTPSAIPSKNYGQPALPSNHSWTR